METSRKFDANNQTFIVDVKSRQNGTWQGVVTWVQGQRKQSFRSALELIKLVDSALGAPDDQRWEEEAADAQDS